MKKEPVPWVPWNMGFTFEANEKLDAHYGKENLEKVLGNHFLGFGAGGFEDIGDNRFKDIFGVVWNRSEDKDIGVIEGRVLPEPSLRGLSLPDPEDKRFYSRIDTEIQKHPDLFRVFSIGFSLFERAWTMRGMEELLMDFYENPGFVRELLHALADFNIASVKKAVKYDIDAIYFGDDWGQQKGLIMGPDIWRDFIKPELKRMYGAVKEAGKFVMIHSCGDVDELFDDLAGIGLDCFNPFQPEVMDVFALMEKYHGRLAFHGGLSTQRTLPYGTPDDVRREVRRLIEAGKNGGYIFAPAHAVEGDAPLENMVAMIEEITSQPGGP
jgi:uroporphyrinogen decarboxylase